MQTGDAVQTWVIPNFTCAKIQILKLIRRSSPQSKSVTYELKFEDLYVLELNDYKDEVVNIFDQVKDNTPNLKLARTVANSFGFSPL